MSGSNGGEGESIQSLTSTESSKRALTLNDALSLGWNLQYLRMTAGEQGIVRQNGDHVVGTLEMMEAVLNKTDFESVITNQVSREKENLIDKYDSNEHLKEDDGRRLSERAESWCENLAKELSDERRIPVGKTGLFNVEKAMDSPEELFDETAWEWLTEQARADIEEACRSLAVNCSTACVMLSLRAVEECLRRWYENEKGDRMEDTWGRVLGSLEEEFHDDRQKRPTVLSNLDYLLDKRNEVMHPHKSPSHSEAVTTLYMVRQNITEIYLNSNN